MMLEIVKEYENEIPSLLKQLKDKHVGDAEKHKAEIIFSTVHRCKGMEYDVVELANDFITEDKLERLSKQPEFKEQKSRIEEEINLLYVAITRAKTVLKIPEEMLPENFVLDASVVAIKKPEPVLKQEIALPNYAVRKKSSYLQEFDSHFSKIREKSPSAYRPWSDELDEELETMFDAGKTYQEMSVEFERSKGAIISRLKKLGLIPS
jgi:hypothetical protein